eukprot:6031422-Prymnesium_polylepis.1
MGKAGGEGAQRGALARHIMSQHDAILAHSHRLYIGLPMPLVPPGLDRMVQTTLRSAEMCENRIIFGP